MLTEIILLVFAGIAAGFVGGLVGVGGGLIFAPVLLFYFQGIGVPQEVIAPLTIGSSLFCTLVVSLSSAHSQYQKMAVDSKMALNVGSASAIAIVLMTFFITTTSWYNATVFKIVFASLLIFVALQMFLSTAARRDTQPSLASNAPDDSSAPDTSSAPDGTFEPVGFNAMDDSTHEPKPVGAFGLLATGVAVGVVATAAGLGGGIVMVPVYHRVFKMPMIRSAGTSSATIVLVSVVGVISYAYSGWGLNLAPLSVGYVDVGRALLLSVPAAFTARIGVRMAHRFDAAVLRKSFAVVAFVVAFRLLMSVSGLE
ncbi:MAG: sulfite exporter TauE/SafE family protein [Rhodothermia bacterium]|nr:MAG: sulfite exporter TauE/SafE family protein [Rhodothermia bacterium]